MIERAAVAIASGNPIGLMLVESETELIGLSSAGTKFMGRRAAEILL
jgi:hypothetical protein